MLLLLALTLACRSDYTVGDGDLITAGETGSTHETGDPGNSSQDSGSQDSGSQDSGSQDSGSQDSGSSGDTSSSQAPGEPEVLETRWCLDFEDGSLAPVGYKGSYHEAEDGGLAFVVAEGDDWSALLGEELLDLRGEHALVLRSSLSGDPTSAGEATTASFTVEDDHLWWWHLSEVGDDGVQIAVELLDAEDEQILASLQLPADSGGFIPALKPEHEAIAGYPEITWGEPTAGALVPATLDLSAFRGQQLRLRLRQHTTVQDNGFFTLFDDLCAGQLTSADLLLER